MEVLKTQNLNISLWHNDTFGRNSFLGEVDLDLSEWDFSNTQINEYALKARVRTSSIYTQSVCIVEVIWLDIYSPLLNPSGLSTNFNTVSLTSDEQQRTDESCPEIPAADVPQWADDFSVLISFVLWVSQYHLLSASTGKRTSRMETGEVQIWVKDCKNLPPVRGVIIDPFVKW